jgi:hypothetical protein
VLSREFIISNNLTDVEISAGSGIFVGQYGTTIRECSWSMVLSARTHGEVNASLRSRPGSVNVRKMGQETGWGGGHDRAGGFKFLPENGEPVDTSWALEKVFLWMRDHTPVLE